MWKKIKLYRKQILALNWLMIIDLFCFRSTMSETECEYWQKGHGARGILDEGVLARLQKEHSLPSFHAR